MPGFGTFYIPPLSQNEIEIGRVVWKDIEVSALTFLNVTHFGHPNKKARHRFWDEVPLMLLFKFLRNVD